MYVEPFIGFRGWSLDEKQIALAGRTLPVRWEYNKPTHAACQETTFKRYSGPPHDAPHFECSCGLHAYETQEILEQRQIPHECSTMGAMVCWGKLIQHDDGGFRAEFARPICLVRRDESPWFFTLLHKVAENYSIPVIDKNDLTAYARTFGHQVAL